MAHEVLLKWLRTSKQLEKRDNRRIFYRYLLTYLLTPWSRVLLEKLTGSAARQEMPRIFGTRRFLTVPKAPATCPYPEPTPSSTVTSPSNHRCLKILPSVGKKDLGTKDPTTKFTILDIWRPRNAIGRMFGAEESNLRGSSSQKLLN